MGSNSIYIHRDHNWSADVNSVHLLNDHTNHNDTGHHAQDQPIDFLYKLAIERCYLPPLTCILNYLTPKDLSSAACVNRQWNVVVKQLPKPRTRLQSYLKELRLLRKSVGEENWPLKEPENKTTRPSSRKALAQCAPQEQVHPRTVNALKFTPAVKKQSTVSNSTHKTPMNRMLHEANTPLPGSTKSKRNLKRL